MRATADRTDIQLLLPSRVKDLEIGLPKEIFDGCNRWAAHSPSYDPVDCLNSAKEENGFLWLPVEAYQMKQVDLTINRSAAVACSTSSCKVTAIDVP